MVWIGRVLLLGSGVWTARAQARDFVRAHIRQLVRERLWTGLLITVAQLALLAVVAVAVHRSGDPLAGRLIGSALVWLLIAYNLVRFFSSTLPDIVEARRHLSGPLGFVVRRVLGISVARELVEMELFALGICLALGLYARFGVSSTFHLLAPWRELLGMRGS